MQYLRYILNNYPIIAGRIIFLIVSAISAYGLAFFTYKINKLFKLMIKPNWVTILSVFLVSLLFAAVTVRGFFRYCLDGSITDVYFLDNGKQIRLIVWYTMENDRYREEYYSNRLKSFDLESGKKINTLDLNYYYEKNDYEIFGFYDERYAWGYTEQRGVQLIDLFDLKVVIDNDQIRLLNPQLGDYYKLVPEKAFNKKDHSLLLSNNKGKIIRIFPEYNKKSKSDSVIEITPQSNSSIENKIDIKKYFGHNTAKVFTTLKQGNETFVFVSMRGFTLSALRVDSKTNEVLGRIDYF